MLSKSSTTVPEQLFKSLSPVLRFNRIFCLLPLEWKKVNTNYVITRSTTYSIYSLVMITLMVTAAIYGRVQLSKIGVFQLITDNPTAALVTYTDFTIVLSVSSIYVALTHRRVNKYVDLTEILKKVDCYLMKNYGKNIFLTILFIAYAIFVLISESILWWRSAVRPKLNYFHTLFYNFPHYFCYFLYVIMELVYWQTVNFVRIRLSTLNTRLLELFHNSQPTRPKEQTIKHVFIKRQQDGEKGELNQIQGLIKAYELLEEATETINECFGFTILIAVFGCLFHGAVTLYHVYTMGVILKASLSDIILQPIWMVLHLVRLFLIVEPCHGCLFEVKKSSKLVCKLLNSGFGEEIEKSLKFFLLYMSKCEIEFSAYGLTKISRGILATIAGTIATYLVILFQFN